MILSLVEFVRQADPMFEDAKVRASRVPEHHLSIITAHFGDGQREPFAVIEYTPQPKEERDALVNNVDLLAEEDQPDLDYDGAIDAKDAYLEAVAALDKLVRDGLMREHNAFMTHEGSRSLLELGSTKVFQPPETLPPRRLEARAFREQPKVGDLRPRGKYLSSGTAVKVISHSQKCLRDDHRKRP
jgi:hypothetical protein